MEVLDQRPVTGLGTRPAGLTTSRTLGVRDRVCAGSCDTGTVDLEESLLARADELMVDAPGVVAVSRLSHIDEVKALRAARAVMDDDDRKELARLRLVLMERLDGVLAVDAVEAKRVPQQKKGLRGAVAGAFRRASDNMANAVPTQASFGELARDAGTVTRLPPPPDLLDAAEAWALSWLVADRVDVDLSIIRRSWDEATVSPPQ